MGIVYFLIYLFLEILVSYEFAKIFTPFGLFLEVIFSAITGVYILQTLHISLAKEMQKLMYGEITQEEFMKSGLFKMLGAILLIIPGVFSDILGVLFLMEPIARWFAKKLFKKAPIYTSPKEEDEIIDVEIVEIIEKKP